MSRHATLVRNAQHLTLTTAKQKAEEDYQAAMKMRRIIAHRITDATKDLETIGSRDAGWMTTMEAAEFHATCDRLRDLICSLNPNA
jgi:predicted transcriptional regulator